MLSAAVYFTVSLAGAVAFLYPFWLPALPQNPQMGLAHANDSPLVLTILVGFCFAILLLEVESHASSAKTIALLGVLVAINSVLRFAEVAVPGPGGFSPVFLLIVLGGYVFGGDFGFLMGALTLLVSGLITGGVGPWLPYQMFTAGWVGLSSVLCRPAVRALGGPETRGELWVLTLFIGAWGLLYGAIMNIWFWPFLTDSGAFTWSPGLGLAQTVQRYGAFYLLTSLVWDVARLLGNVLLMLAFGRPVLRVLRRFQRRFEFTYVAEAGNTHPRATVAAAAENGTP